MKKFTIVALTILTFAGCKKSSTVQPTTIVGTWYLNSTNTVYYTNGSKTGTDDSQYIAHTYYATFNADGTGVEYNSVANVPAIAPFKFTFSKSDSTITLNFPQQVIDGVTYGSTQVQASIETLAGSNLTLVFTSIFTGTSTANLTEKETQYFAK